MHYAIGCLDPLRDQICDRAQIWRFDDHYEVTRAGDHVCGFNLWHATKCFAQMRRPPGFASIKI